MTIKVDQLIRSKRKTLQISITPDARLVVRAPLNLPLKLINRFVEEKREWIERKKASVRAAREHSLRKDFNEGAVFSFLGSNYSLSIKEDHTEIRINGTNLEFPARLMTAPAVHLEQWYMTEARRYIGSRLKELSASVGIQYKSFGITRARRRWGSCSPKDSLNFTWRLMQAKPGAIDYVIIHELCHVRVKNHSQAFWNIVGRILPDYRILRKWLRDHRELMMDWTDMGKANEEPVN
jgi:predicted metal-dependent hydrolase